MYVLGMEVGDLSPGLLLIVRISRCVISGIALVGQTFVVPVPGGLEGRLEASTHVRSQIRLWGRGRLFRCGGLSLVPQGHGVATAGILWARYIRNGTT